MSKLSQSNAQGSIKNSQLAEASASRNYSVSMKQSLPSFAHLKIDPDTSSEDNYDAESEEKDLRSSAKSIRAIEELSVTDEDLMGTKTRR